MDGDCRPPDEGLTDQRARIGQRQLLRNRAERSTSDKQRGAVCQPQGPDLERGQAERVPCGKQNQAKTNGQNPIHYASKDSRCGHFGANAKESRGTGTDFLSTGQILWCGV